MRTLNIPFEDKEYADLKERKGKKSWREFILNKKKEEIQNV